MPGRCTVPWCDQGTKPHSIHEWTVATRLGHTRTTPGDLDRRARSVQLVVFGRYVPEPMLAIVDGDTHEQTEVVLRWDELAGLLEEVAPARDRVVPGVVCSCPPNGPDKGCEMHGPWAEEFIPEPDAEPPF